MALKVHGASVFNHRISRLRERANSHDVELFSDEEDVDVWISKADPPPFPCKVWIQHGDFSTCCAEHLQECLKKYNLEVSILSHRNQDHPLVTELHLMATREGKITSFANEAELDRFLVEEFYGSGN